MSCLSSRGRLLSDCMQVTDEFLLSVFFNTAWCHCLEEGEGGATLWLTGGYHGMPTRSHPSLFAKRTKMATLQNGMFTCFPVTSDSTDRPPTNQSSHMWLHTWSPCQTRPTETWLAHHKRWARVGPDRERNMSSQDSVRNNQSIWSELHCLSRTLLFCQNLITEVSHSYWTRGLRCISPVSTRLLSN